MKVYYFGCWGQSGHYLFTPDGHSRDSERRSLPWVHIDAALCPGRVHPRHKEVESADQHEGHAALHHKGGWTALAFWDRSVDARHGSNSVLLAEGTWSAEDMLAHARRHFPAITKRFKFAITVVQTSPEAA